MSNHHSIFNGNVFLRAVRVDLHRAVVSRRFLLTVGLMLAWLTMNGGTEIFIYGFLYKAGIPSVFNSAITGSHGWGMIVLSMATMPYATSFLTDQETGFCYHAINRVGFHAYAIARVISVGLSAFLAIVTAAGVFLLGLCLSGAPIDTIPGNGQSFNGIYTDFVLQVGPWCYFLVRFVLSGLSVAMAAVFALCVSTFIPNPYVVLLAPLILYYGWDAIMTIFYHISGGTIRFVKYFAMINNITFQVSPNNGFSFVWSTTFLLTLTALSGRCFVRRLRKEQGL